MKLCFFLAALLLALSAWTAQAADVDGQWVAQMPGRGGQTQEATFTFKADGDALTGNMSNGRGQLPIADGKVDGDEISFTQTMQMGENKLKLVYKGKVSGDEIKFTRQRDGQGQAQAFTAKRKAS